MLSSFNILKHETNKIKGATFDFIYQELYVC